MEATATTTRVRWTPEEAQALLMAGNAAGRGELSSLFERVAAERGVSAATVRTKYYALRSRPGGASRSRARGRGRARWTAREERRLVKEVTEAAPQARAGVFQAWADRRGVNVEAIQGKFYRVRRAYQEAVGTDAGTVPSSPSQPVVAGIEPIQTIHRGASVELGHLALGELAALGREVNEEIERRVVALRQSVV